MLFKIIAFCTILALYIVGTAAAICAGYGRRAVAAFMGVSLIGMMALYF